LELPQSAAPPAQTLDARPSALIKSGEHPLWFELAGDRDDGEGPFQINAPDEAALTPFVPWTLARFVTGMILYEDKLIAAVNRAGFLMFGPWSEGVLAVYRITDSPYWENYTIGSLFMFEGNPAALLYQDDFFVDPVGFPPSPRVLAQINGTPQPVGISVPAFDPFPPSGGWNLETLRQGPDGYWYYRGVRRADPQPSKTVYFRTSALSLPGEPVSLSEFRNAAIPSPLHTAPPVLKEVVNKAFSLSGSQHIPIAAIISPAFPYTRYFTGDPGFASRDKPLVELSGYYLNAGGIEQALVILPDGRGMFGKTAPEQGAFVISPIDLPTLPKDFVYTRIGLFGQTLVAAWEEQQDMSVGAAGLMVIKLQL
jgi:hypothetical protein